MKSLIASVMLASLAAAGAAQDTVKRRPLAKDGPPLRVRHELQSPMTRVDPKTGETIPYDVKPMIVALDERTGRYAFRWIGYDGQPKQVVYHRPDRIDAEVMASVVPEGAYHRYVYRVRVLPSSAQPLLTFLVQNFARDAWPHNAPHLLVVGPAPQFPSEFPGSRWIGFSMKRPGTPPGEDAMFEIVSPGPPGLVQCKISGATGAIQGIGEELPPELAEALPGYEAWPHGYTIGPSDELTTLDAAARARRLATWLPQFERLGWITAAARQRYERTIQEHGIGALLPSLKTDAASRQVTTEVVAVVQGLASRK